MLLWEVLLPNIICATVGGGTHLPTQKECLEIMECYGEGKRDKLVEIIAATALANEVSLISAIAAGEWVRSHQQLRSRM